jgi:hypothetical protein
VASLLDAVTSPGYDGCPMLDEGFWAEIKIGDEHLRLFSERSDQGAQASVFNVNTKTWIAPSEAVGDIEHGKERAEAYAEPT